MTAATAPMTLLLELPATSSTGVVERITDRKLPAADDCSATDAWYCGVDLATASDVSGDRCQDVVPELIVELL